MIIVCPDCGKRFSAQPNWPEYEVLVSELCNGTKATNGTSGYDVIGPDGIRYQVKMANERKGSWMWFGRFPNAGADFYVLFRIDYMGRDTMYILTERDWNILGKVNRKSDFNLLIREKSIYKIAPFQCEINGESFRNRIDQLKSGASMIGAYSFQLKLNIPSVLQ